MEIGEGRQRILDEERTRIGGTVGHGYWEPEALVRRGSERRLRGCLRALSPGSQAIRAPTVTGALGSSGSGAVSFESQWWP
jgi:hypothetical protein